MAGQGRHANVKGEIRECELCGHPYHVIQAWQRYCSQRCKNRAALNRWLAKGLREAMDRLARSVGYGEGSGSKADPGHRVRPPSNQIK
jgi:endogenous inhibitor of DNA gyrase (YacG/DUF329 family)